MSISETVKKSLEKFEEEYGEKHYQVCEGKDCVCRKVLKDFLLQSQIELLEEILMKANSHQNTYDALGNFIEELSQTITNLKNE